MRIRTIKKGKINMARILKENMNTPFFHIMVQGNNKDYIFDLTEDKNKFLEIMSKTKEKINTTILAYCIMNNHTHLLFYEEDTSKLIQYMHNVNLRYAKYYNKKHNRVGYVFRDRYKTQPIYSEKHLYSCVRYIHNNPVKANISRKPNEYKYSSCCHNIFYANTQLENNIKKYMCIEENLILNDNQNFILMENEINKEQTANEIFEETIKENNVPKEKLGSNEELIYLLIRKLKYENAISYRMMENILGISRKKLRKIELKQEKRGEV